MSQWDWIETVSKVAGKLGFNSMRVRWKLMRWQQSTRTQSVRAADTVRHVGYSHRMCSNCGRVQDRSAKKCVNCGHSFSPHFIEVLNRFGLVIPDFVSASTVLIVAIIGCFLRTATANGGFSILDISGLTLVKFGANFPPFVLAGEWWRLGTCVFLHAGLMHILFNVIALQQIGPEVERLFGRGKFVMFFMLTGIVASAGSLVWHYYVMRTGMVGIGASGAIMGLVGLAAGWGHKDNTSIGLSVRDMMLKWGAYTIVFGLIVGADNAAHIAGFICGGLVGFAAHPKTRRHSSTFTWVLSIVGIILATGSVILIMFPPALPQAHLL
jgi:rhomboid protease GluP